MTRHALRPRVLRTLVAAAVLALITLTLAPAGATASVVSAVQPKAADDPTLPRSQVAVTKSNDLDGAALTPGGEFKYQLTVQCSGLRVDCVNETFTDTLPAGLDVTSLPQDTPARTVTYDAATRVLTVVYKEALQNPEGELGLKAGSTRNFEIGMRLPADTSLKDGATITNTANVDADNADPASDDNVIAVSVPRKVTPVATKAWADGSAVAGTGEQTTATLGIRNGSSSSAEITSLTVTDDTAATYENFDLTGVTLTSFPAGANRAQLFVKTTGGFVPGPVAESTGPLTLPGGVAVGDVTGVRVVFTDAAGAVLPYDATGGKVELGLKLRDTKRSDGSPIKPAGKLTVNNCASPSAADKVQGAVTGADACKSFDILPDTLALGSSKAFFPDTNGNFSQDNDEYAVLGENSAVSAKVDVKNNSPFNIAEITIVDPDASGKVVSEFDKFDTSKVRLRFPSGATKAALSVTYDDGTTFANDYTAGATVSVAQPGKRVTSVKVVYTGRDADGNGRIAQGATAGLDLAGNLNASVTAADLPDGSSPGVIDCAGYTGSAGRTDGTGTASGAACKTLDIQPPRGTSEGVKDVGQGTVPPGQPIPFTLRVSNNGNLPLVRPVISDPRTRPDGTPDPNFTNPFDTLRLTGASVSKDSGTPAVTIEVYDPTVSAWVPFNTSDAALLQRAKGVRATMQGNLTPTKSFTLNLITQRRDGTGNGTPILNCFSTSAGGNYTPADPACAPQIETGPANDSASLNKSISPGTLPVFVPGLPPQAADVKLTVRNNGNLSAQFVQATDNDADFFDGVNFTGFKPVQFPVGANRVRVDAFVNGAWVLGTPAAQAALPAGVAAADVTGVRATFSSTNTANDGYVLTPCDARSCEGVLTFTVSPRQFLRSDPTQTVPTSLENTVSGEFLTQLQLPGGIPRQIDPVDATLTLTKGTPKLDVDKSPNSVIAPGETAPFNLKVTNVGTANVPDLVVKDTIPKGISFDDTFVGDSGLPFKVIATQVPAGTPPVPTPVFAATSTGDRVSSLSFDFSKNADGTPFLLAPGATLTIQIQVTLAPGVSAGDVETNTMGASSSDSDLTCAGASGVDGPFGAGRYCTDTATLTAKAGAAFQARKWVAGTASLGWYDTRTKTKVGVGARACPSTADASGRQYTAFPCIALVNPGDQYKYLLRLVNSGTEPATDMRIIDRFPVQGDKGVIINQDRGTEWNNRPTLASQPALDGPGVLSTTYSDAEPICTKDLDMGGAGSSAPQCAAGDWASPFSPAVVAAQMRVAFATPLAPGAGVDITFAMDTPLSVDQVSDPTIAWNSYAHAETTLRGGKPHVLPKTEPIQVGVGLAYGSLSLKKKIGENPSNLPLDSVSFPYQVKCVIHPVDREDQVVLNQEYEVSVDQPVTIPGLPSGADCSVWETDAQGGVSDHPESDPVKVTIGSSLGSDTAIETALITNDFPDAILRIRKDVTGDAAKYGKDVYPISVFCTFQGQPVDGYYPKKMEVRPPDPKFVVDVPSGARCYAIETDSGGATEVTYDPAQPQEERSGAVTTASGKPADISITNEFRAGGLQISKDVTGPGAPELSDGPFTFDVACSFDGRDDVFTKTVTLTGDGTGKTLESDPITGLPVGAVCTVTESDTGGADSPPNPVTVTIPDEQDGTAQVVVAGFVNAFSAGTIDLTKKVEGDGADADYVKNATFTVQLTCQRDNAEGERVEVFSAPVDVKADETVTVLGADGKPVKVPLGSHCYGAETNTGGATSHAVDFDSYDNAAIVTNSAKPQQLSITATNTFDLGALALTKKVDGDAASYVGDREFTLAVTCVLPQGQEVPTTLFADRPYTVTDGKTVTVDELPVGAQCWAAETDTGGATGSVVDHGDPSSAAVVGADDVVSIHAVNTFDAGTLVVTKKVVNGGPGPYSFTLACTTDQGKVELKASDAAFTLKAGERRTIVVPLGARCTVIEVDVAKGDTVTYVDSDHKNDGSVAVHGDAAVTVTNTFAKQVGDTSSESGQGGNGAGSPANGGLPGTGGPSLWIAAGGLLALLAGTGLVRRRRRATDVALSD